MLSWLQETSDERVWTNWGVTYRDVWILDSSNRLSGVFNLTQHDLSRASEFTALKSMFIAVANSGDGDKDSLPDQWEALYPESTEPDADKDGDGYSNFVEFAFGTHPQDPTSYPVIRTTAPAGQLTLSFTRWAGTPFQFVVEGSTNLTTWSGARITATKLNRYDGTGRATTSYKLPRPVAPLPMSFARVKLQRN